MADPEPEADRLRRELTDIESSFWAEFADTAMGWEFTLGPLRLKRHASPMFIVQVFVLFHVLCFAAGAALIFAAGSARELGIAMVVGSIFAFGAFVAQFWAVSYERAREVYSQSIGDQGALRLRQLLARRDEVLAQIEQAEEGGRPL